MFELKYKGKVSLVFFLMQLFSMTTQGAFAQNPLNEIYSDVTDKFGFKIATNGLGFNYRHSEPFKNKLCQSIDVDFTSLKHPVEKDIINTRLANTRPYIYNKVNRVYSLRALLGGQYIFAGRTSKNSVGISGFAGIGPSFNFVKPMFLDVQTIDPNNPNAYIVVSKRYEPETINPTQIVGNSSYFTGIGQTHINFGMAMKAGVEFNWGTYSSEFKSIELGFTVDYLPVPPTIIYTKKNKAVFSGFYISFAIGRNK